MSENFTAHFSENVLEVEDAVLERLVSDYMHEHPVYDGKSAYEIAVIEGFEGDVDAWLASLKGEQGIQGIQGIKGDKGDKGDNAAITGVTASVDNTVGTPSVNVQMGGTDLERSFNFDFHNLKGVKGDKGDKGATGKSAYEIAVDNGYEGTEAEWVEEFTNAILNASNADSKANSAVSTALSANTKANNAVSTANEVKEKINYITPEISSIKANETISNDFFVRNNELSYKPDSQPYIMLYVDDCRNDLSDMWEIAQEYGVPLNIACPTNTLNNTAKNGQKIKDLLHDMENAGCEIHSHSINFDTLHENTTRAQAFSMLKDSKEALQAEGFKVNGFIFPGGNDAYANQWDRFADLVREYYLYSDCNIYPKGLNKTRSNIGLNAPNTFIDGILNTTTKALPARKIFMHAIGVDISESGLRYLIEQAQSRGIIITTEYDYYKTHVISASMDRLNRIERLLLNKPYTLLEYELFVLGYGTPNFDVSAYPYALYYKSGTDPTVIVSEAELVLDKSQQYYFYRKADNKSVRYQRYKFLNGAWKKETDSTATAIATSLTKNPVASNYDIYDDNGALVLSAENRY